jgi:hypothetical protein
VDDARFDDLSRRLGMHERPEGVAGDGARETLRSSGGRRSMLGSLGAAGIAMVAGLGLQTATAKKKSKHKPADAERHKHGKKGKPGAKGPTGPTGPTGPAGSGSGSAGATGPTGPTGPMGPAGPSGSAGETGLRGETGPQGITGPDGATGPQGEPGPSAGTMYWARVDSNGDLIGGYGVDRVDRDRSQNGTYTVHFTDTDQNFGVCAITALADRLPVSIQPSSGHGFIIFQTVQSGFLVNEGFSCIVVCPAT